MQDSVHSISNFDIDIWSTENNHFYQPFLRSNVLISPTWACLSRSEFKSWSMRCNILGFVDLCWASCDTNTTCKKPRLHITLHFLWVEEVIDAQSYTTRLYCKQFIILIACLFQIKYAYTCNLYKLGLQCAGNTAESVVIIISCCLIIHVYNCLCAVIEYVAGCPDILSKQKRVNMFTH